MIQCTKVKILVFQLLQAKKKLIKRKLTPKNINLLLAGITGKLKEIRPSLFCCLGDDR